MPSRIRRLPLDQLLATLDPRGPVPAERPDTAIEIAEMARFLLYRTPLPLHNTCMVRSLTLYHCLRAEGAPASVVFGVKPGKEIREGHAWLELRGEPYLEPDARRRGFSPIFRYPQD